MNKNVQDNNYCTTLKMHDFVRQYKKELDNKHTYYEKMLENVRQNIYDQKLSRKNR